MCYLFNSRDNKHITTLLIENMRHIDRAAGEAYRRNLRVADTIFFEFHLLYYFFNKSLIRELFPFYIHAFYESGLFDQYYKNKSSAALQYKQDVFVIKAFGVGDLSIVWFLYIGGVIVSVVWFWLEILCYQIQRCVRTLQEWRSKKQLMSKWRLW
uniref:Uncharacterized protein n=1 Tax=Anopheles maculatus TaxID=74869 RepID=A0A182S926_9DIPT